MRSSTVGAVALSMLLGACASVISGTSDNVKIEPDKPARCVVADLERGQQMAALDSAPGVVILPRTSADLTVTCTTPDGNTKTVPLPSELNGWTFGNFLLLFPMAIVGLVVDGMSGAYHGYDDVQIEMPAGS